MGIKCDLNTVSCNMDTCRIDSNVRWNCGTKGNVRGNARFRDEALLKEWGD